MTVLLLGDITGRSRVALRMLSAVLEACGHEVLMLPTALISNTLNLGRHEALDTTDYLLRSLKTWRELGIRYDLAYVGYITGMAQANTLCGVIDDLHEQGVRVVLDPIMGDNGKKYNSVTQEQAEGFRLLMQKADILTPNLTEAGLLLGMDSSVCDAAEMACMLSDERRGVLITSARNAAGQDAVIGYDPECGEIELRFERVPGHHWGTGDLFTGLLMDELLRGMTLEMAAKEAALHVAAQLCGREKSFLPEQSV